MVFQRSARVIGNDSVKVSIKMVLKGPIEASIRARNFFDIRAAMKEGGRELLQNLREAKVKVLTKKPGCPIDGSPAIY